VFFGLLLEELNDFCVQDTRVKVAPETQVTIMPDYRERMEGEEERRKQEGRMIDIIYCVPIYIHTSLLHSAYRGLFPRKRSCGGWSSPLVQRLRIVEQYLHTPIRHCGVLLN
jgi:hypothetical protein